MHRTDLTVAAVIERDDKFLLVEEFAMGRRVMTQPGGHIEADESPWRPGTDERFAVDFLTALPLDRLLEAVGRVDGATLRHAQRAVVMSL